ncbi:MAG: DUF542 domain-containing protein [Vicinamibacterales bacterium]
MTIATTLAELAVTRPGATRVFHRYRLDFSCRGGRSLVEACRERRLDPGAILAAIEASAAARRPDALGSRAAVRAGRSRRVHSASAPARPVAGARRGSAGRRAATARGPRRIRAASPAIADLHHSVLEHLEKEEHLLFPLIVSGQGTQAGGSTSWRSSAATSVTPSAADIHICGRPISRRRPTRPGADCMQTSSSSRWT